MSDPVDAYWVRVLEHRQHIRDTGGDCGLLPPTRDEERAMWASVGVLYEES